MQLQYVFRGKELYALVSQMRRAAVLIPSNMAKGKGRLTDRKRSHSCGKARVSRPELETQIRIATELNYISEQSETLREFSEEIGKLLNGLVFTQIRHLQRNVPDRIPHLKPAP